MRLLIFFFITTQVFSQINWTSFNTSTSDIPYNQIKALEFDANGNLFVGTAYGLGILNIENNSWDVYFNDDPDIGLIDNDIINISKSLTDSMWICTTNGISIFFNQQWSYLNMNNSILPSNISRTIFFENDAKTWIGTTSGLIVIENNIWDLQLFDSEGIFSNNIRKIIKDPENENIYIGTLNGGFQIYNNGNFEGFNNLNSGLLDNTINDFIFDINNNLIMSTPFGGLGVLTENNSWTWFNSVTYPYLPFFINSLNNLIIDNNNNLWISTVENGLIKYTNNTWTFYNEENSGLLDDRINCLKYDNTKNHLWVGTETEGLMLMDLNNMNINNNPKPDFLNYSFSNQKLQLNAQEGGVLNLFNINGNLILNTEIQKGLQDVPINKLGPGIYLINLNTKTKNFTQKIIKTI